MNTLSATNSELKYFSTSVPQASRTCATQTDGLSEPIKELLLALVVCLNWQHEDIGVVKAARETLATSSKLSRQFTNCTHSGNVIALLDKHLLDLQDNGQGKEKLKKMKDNHAFAGSPVAKYDTQMVAIVGRMRIEFTGIVANAPTTFRTFAHTEIKDINAILSSSADLIESWAVRSFVDSLGKVIVLLLDNKDANNDATKGSQCAAT